jgi:hypothetical protein
VFYWDYSASLFSLKALVHVFFSISTSLQRTQSVVFDPLLNRYNYMAELLVIKNPYKIVYHKWGSIARYV